MAEEHTALIARMRTVAVALADLKVAYGCEYNIPIALDKTIAWLTGEADYLEKHTSCSTPTPLKGTY